MADSRIQLEIEKWIRDNFLPQKYHQQFTPRRLQLNTEGFFDFDAVSADDTIVANISTSSYKTSGGKNGSGKIQKIRSDMLFLLMVPAKKRLIVFSEEDMFDYFMKEKQKGRVPNEVELIYSPIPENLRSYLLDAKKIAAHEVSPMKPYGEKSNQEQRKSKKEENMEIHVEVFIASKILGKNQPKFSKNDLMRFIHNEFKDDRPGITTHISSSCVANAPLNHASGYNYLWRENTGEYRCFHPGNDLPKPERVNDRYQPLRENVPEEYRYLLLKE